MVLDVILAAARQRGAGAVLTPDAAGPVAAEGGVEDDVVVLEMLVDAAAGPAARESGGGGTPCRRVGVGAQGVAGETVVAREIPDVDGGAGPFHRVDACAGVVHVGSVIVALGRFDGATEISLAVVTRQATTAARVHGHLVLTPRIDAFDDIDLPAVRPVRPRHPERGPGATDAGGHVGEIEDDEAVGVLGFGCETDAVAAATGCDASVVDAPCDLAVADVEEV